MDRTGLTVNLAYYRLPHIDAASGYVQLGRYLADKAPVRLLDPVALRRVPDAVLGRIGRSRSLAFYEPAGLRLELAVMRRLLEAPGEVCHVLYGEDHFNHLARFRHLPRRRRGTLVATFHQPPGTFERVVGGRDLRARLEALDAAIVMSGAQAEMLRGLMASERVHHLPHGVNAFHFRPPGEPPPAEPVRCLAVGAWLRDYGTLRAAIELVAAEEPAIELEVVAPAGAAAALEGAPGTVVRSGISGEELLAAYQRAHLFVHPLADGAANNALAEAMGCGLPVVATASGGVPEYVPPEAGVLTPPGDPAAMASAILALARDPERRRAMGRAAREAALAHDWPHVAWLTLRVYEAAAAA
jgi:glycosyltransferase involved in cell wall biosynthesis